MTDLHIREARPEDVDALWAILEPVIRDGTTYPVDPAASRADILAFWLAPGKRVYVAEAGGAILGTYALKANSIGLADHVANGSYMVHPEARGRGVARAMAEDSFVRAKALGFHAMQFNLVVSTNLGALKLWRSVGMEEVGRLKEAFRHPELGLVDAVVMYRLL